MSEKKEKQTFNTKLYECCATDELRPVMQCIYFNNGFAYASNGIVCIKQTMSFHSVIALENLDGRLLHRDSYKTIMGFEFAEANGSGIECWNTNGQKAFFEYFEPGPNDKIPNFEAMINPKRGLTSLSFIGFNPGEFDKLVKALYAPAGNYRLQFTGIDSPILVDVVGIDDQWGIIMPIILNNSFFD